MASTKVAAALEGTIKPKKVARMLRKTSPRTGLPVGTEKHGLFFKHLNNLRQKCCEFLAKNCSMKNTAAEALCEKLSVHTDWLAIARLKTMEELQLFWTLTVRFVVDISLKPPSFSKVFNDLVNWPLFNVVIDTFLQVFAYVDS